MENLNNKSNENVFAEFILSNDEMICVRGGDAEDFPKITDPPVIP